MYLKFFLFLFITSTCMAAKEPHFEVLRKTDEYEVRRLDPVLVAEVELKGTLDKVGDEGFRILADYIFGNNKSAHSCESEKISMTAPVSIESSQKIAMTAPVSVTSGGYDQMFYVQFTMPSEYTLQTIPQPKDPRVKLRDIPSRLIAVIKYSGRWTESNYQEHLDRLMSLLKKDKVMMIGQPVWSRFDPPFMPWFMRRNEIWIEIKG